MRIARPLMFASLAFPVLLLGTLAPAAADAPLQPRSESVAVKVAIGRPEPAMALAKSPAAPAPAPTAIPRTRILGVAALALACIPLLVLLRRRRQHAARTRGSEIEVVSTHTLGAKHRLAVVTVRGESFLLATSDKDVRLLARLAPAVEEGDADDHALGRRDRDEAAEREPIEDGWMDGQEPLCDVRSAAESAGEPPAEEADLRAAGIRRSFAERIKAAFSDERPTAPEASGARRAAGREADAIEPPRPATGSSNGQGRRNGVRGIEAPAAPEVEGLLRLRRQQAARRYRENGRSH
jgi:flagellar biogenesis protein FliO